jgi:hypothetical protein
MDPITVGKHYCLRLPDGRPLGHVRITRIEDGWAEGPFQPGQSFAEFAALFEREAQLRHDQIIPLWEEAADAIEALRIQVVEEGQGAVQGPLRIFVEGGEAILGPPLAAPLTGT